MKPQITGGFARFMGADFGRLQRSCGMKPQITRQMPVAIRWKRNASKELRHEAADHPSTPTTEPGISMASKELRHEAADHSTMAHDIAPGVYASKELRHEAADHRRAQ